MKLRFLDTKEVSWFCACMAEVLAKFFCKKPYLFDLMKGLKKFVLFRDSDPWSLSKNPSLDLSRSHGF